MHSHNNTETHSYPPTAVVDNDDPTSECLLCLSSPREVVLLPCRHLVACKECAVNMVEFGAGGQLVHAEETVEVAATAGTTANGESSGVNGEETTAGGTTTVTTTGTTAGATQARPRRKRKPKGWFCPVCRQPYTSLLRISTGSPVCALNSKTKDIDHEDRASSPDTVDSHSHSHQPLSFENENETETVAVMPPSTTVESAPDVAETPTPAPAIDNSNNTNDTDERDITETPREQTSHDQQVVADTTRVESTTQAAE